MANFPININIKAAKSLQEMRAKPDSFLGNESQHTPKFQMFVNMETIKLGLCSAQPTTGKSLVNLFPFHL